MIGRCGRRVCQVLQAQRQLHSSALARADVEFNILSGYLPTKVTRYGRRGFSINNNNYLGSLAVFTNLTLHWKPQTAAEITLDSIAPFRYYHPTPEVLVIGTGDKMEQLDPAIRDALKKHGIALEVLDTRRACATFNFLSEEGRVVAAGLIPPPNFSPNNVQPRARAT